MATSKFHGHPFCTLPAKPALKTEDHDSRGGGGDGGSDGSGSGRGPHLERSETFPQKCTHVHKIFGM